MYRDPTLWVITEHAREFRYDLHENCASRVYRLPEDVIALREQGDREFIEAVPASRDVRFERIVVDGVRMRVYSPEELERYMNNERISRRNDQVLERRARILSN